MSVNLDQFTTKELQVILNMTVARIIELRISEQSLKEICEACESPYPSTDIDRRVIFERETLDLFRVQLLNAIAEVDRKEFINSN